MGLDSIDGSVKIVVVGGCLFFLFMLLLGSDVDPSRSGFLKQMSVKLNSIKDLWQTESFMLSSTAAPEFGYKVTQKNNKVHGISPANSGHSNVDSESVTVSQPKENYFRLKPKTLDEKMKHSFPSFKLSQHNAARPALERRLPTAIIIGASRSGVGALNHFLRLNKNVITAKRENDFFSKHYYKHTEWYRKKMPYSWPDQITIEKNPTYYTSETVALRIFGMNPKILLILVVRNPMTRAISGWLENGRGKKGDRDTLESSFFYSNKTLREDHEELELSLYAKHLKKYLKYFPFQQIHVVDGDQLRKQPAKEMKKVERFLGYRPKIRKGDFVFNKKKGFYCFWKEGDKECLSNSKGREHPTLEVWMVKAFKTYFYPHNKDFYDLVGRSFDWD